MPTRKVPAPAKNGSVPEKNGSAAGNRRHIVLIPGFGGFDALGGVNYYAGITELFQHWSHTPHAHSKADVVLHYFDNLPTAAVVTRAKRLRNYLAKRMARGEIRPDDEIILIGHSTGGLDIRRLICDFHHPLLHDGKNDEIGADGGKPIQAQELRDCIKKVIFLSVPHWGTNIAEWVYRRAHLRKTVIRDLQAAFLGSQHFYLDRIEAGLAGGAAVLTEAQVLLALRDALTEAKYHGSDPSRLADALEAASKLELYFNQMTSDFHVINDLTPWIDNRTPENDPPSWAHFSRGQRKDEPKPWEVPISPAHFSPKQRDEELELWANPRIDCLSYATVGGRAFTFDSGCPAPVFNLINPLDDLRVAQPCGQAADTDISYRLCYRACAGGSLKEYLPITPCKIARMVGPRPPEPVELWDNDGIVNTVSMLWPEGERALVQADHLDIVGHFRLRPEKTDNTADEPPPDSRSYDILRSTPRFHADTFKTVWYEIFNFAARREAYHPVTTGLHGPVAIAAAAYQSAA
jgi:triacylglycerol lipase